MKTLILIALLTALPLFAGEKQPNIQVPGAYYTTVWDHNPKGEYIGLYMEKYSSEAPQAASFYYYKGKYTILAVPGAIATAVISITPHGLVHGIYSDDGWTAYPFTWYRGHYYY